MITGCGFVDQLLDGGFELGNALPLPVLIDDNFFTQRLGKHRGDVPTTFRPSSRVARNTFLEACVARRIAVADRGLGFLVVVPFSTLRVHSASRARSLNLRPEMPCS